MFTFILFCGGLFLGLLCGFILLIIQAGRKEDEGYVYEEFVVQKVKK
jgi:hypothetical protein